jgi:hypothetical protein
MFGTTMQDEGWTLADARHLLDRACFGGTPAMIQRLHILGPEGAVDELLGHSSGFGNGATSNPKSYSALAHRRLARAAEGNLQSDDARKSLKKMTSKNDRKQADTYREFWLSQMAQGVHPVGEKMALFWHGHFTSSIRDVKDSYAMVQQIEMYREKGLGSFSSLLHDITLDPAMLAYLNNDKNKKKAPNENYAREVMELFTLGTGNYTEQDVVEAARAFTGWRTNKETGVARFAKRRHDPSTKTVLGRTGNLGASDVLDILLEQPATAPFLVRKFLNFYATPEPDEAWVAELSTSFRDSGYAIRPLLRKIFLSPAFYARNTRAALFKSPVDFLVSTLRRLEIPPPPGRFMASACDLLGQKLLEPPNVKGWEGGEAWISSSTIMLRANVAWMLMGGIDKQWLRSDEGRALRKFIPQDARELRHWIAAPDPVLLTEGAPDPETAIDAVCNRLLPVAPSSTTRNRLCEYIAPFGPDAYRITEPQTARLVLDAVHMTLSLPEYQLT